MASSGMTADTRLHEEIHYLGTLLGETIRQIAGEDSFQLVESVRRLAGRWRQGEVEAGEELRQLLAQLDTAHMRVVIRAFAVFLDLANLAEDRQRVRVLRERERERGDQAGPETLFDAFQQMIDNGMDVSAVQQLLDRLRVELVLTAHPTEAKRRSVRSKLRNIRNLLAEADRDQLPAERARTELRLRVELTKLWQTDVIRPWRPSVLQEVQRGLSIQPVLWEVVPRILAECRAALRRLLPEQRLRIATCIAFGSWIGGDRDGHPYVTAGVTRQTFIWLRQAALEAHIADAKALADSLSLSERQTPVSGELREAVERSARQWPELTESLARLAPLEMYRRWLHVLLWRLRKTQQVDLEQDACEGAYASSQELDDDIMIMCRSLIGAHNEILITEELVPWLDRVRAFGFHLARLDVRQDARQYRQVMDEVWQKLGLASDPSGLSERERQELLIRTIGTPWAIPRDALSEFAQETLNLFQLLKRVFEKFGADAVGGHVISMTRAPSDVLTVLWMWQQTLLAESSSRHALDLCLPIIPLFETIDDLEHAPHTLRQMLDHPGYRRYLRRQGDRQTIMIGYSDSTKDGGYLSACWETYRAQSRLHEIARQRNVELRFFHGRGGSLGRGGGPAARAILSLPANTFHGTLRLTEQGEVLAERYDDPRIAHRHLEQILWSTILAARSVEEQLPEQWLDAMQRLAQASLEAYRHLVRQPRFVEFFRLATPIDEIERLPIGSRPARRQGGGDLSSLRAIPWVFSWTQSRCLLPAWYGVGAACDELARTAPPLSSELSRMYRQWPFFHATLDNAALALAKTDLAVMRHYLALTRDSESMSLIAQLIADEYERSRRAVLRITGQQQLLDDTQWLQHSIQYRNRYLDPLNMLQVELLRRLRSHEGPDDSPIVEELRHLTRLTIKGLAAGMRTTG